MKIVFLNINRINYDKSINLDYYKNLYDVKFFDFTDYDLILDRVEEADVVVVKEMVLDRNIIMSLPSSVKLICEAGTGYNNIDINACFERGIKVCNVPGYSTNTVALFTMMLILNLSTSYHIQKKMLDNDDYSNFSDNLGVIHSEIDEKTLGIIGMGKIGKRVADMASSLGMKVIYYSKNKKEDINYEYVSLDELLKRSDYVSLHCALTDETFHMINKDKLSLMKKSSFIINTARGNLIDEEALINALKNKYIAGCGVDVVATEPANSSNELFKLDNVIITPHMGWNSVEAKMRLVDLVFDNINNFSKGVYKNIVN